MPANGRLPWHTLLLLSHASAQKGSRYQSRNSTEVWGRTLYAGAGPLARRIDERSLEDPTSGSRLLFSKRLRLDIGVRDGRIVGVRGRESDGANGRLGPRLHGWEANSSAERLTAIARRKGTLRPWRLDEAMTLLVERSQEVCDVHSRLAVAFYVGGQLFLEEYYTLAVIALAGLGTPHLDASVRLSNATASAALVESFGSDGQPGTYDDIDVTDAVLHVGHNVAEQHTVLWMRILDRRHGARPPRLVVVDPRRTDTAREADVHLAPRLGTNVPLSMACCG